MHHVVEVQVLHAVRSLKGDVSTQPLVIDALRSTTGQENAVSVQVNFTKSGFRCLVV